MHGKHLQRGGLWRVLRAGLHRVCGGILHRVPRGHLQCINERQCPEWLLSLPQQHVLKRGRIELHGMPCRFDLARRLGFSVCLH